MLLEVLVTVVVVGGISAILSALLSVSDALVNNYGDVKITINKERNIDTTGGSTLLSTLGAEKVFLPSACGGKGSCGLCKVRVVTDIGPVFPTETPYLSKEETSSGVRLACQIKVKKDLEIVIPEELFNITEYQARVMSGRKIPRPMYNAGENRSMIISSNCTNAAITMINTIKRRYSSPSGMRI